MTIGIIIIALIPACLAFRFIAGMVKFVVLGVVLIAVAYVLLNGGLA